MKSVNEDGASIRVSNAQTLTHHSTGTYEIQYEDGDEESKVDPSNVRRPASPGDLSRELDDHAVTTFS